MGQIPTVEVNKVTEGNADRPERARRRQSYQPSAAALSELSNRASGANNNDLFLEDQVPWSMTVF